MSFTSDLRNLRKALESLPGVNGTKLGLVRYIRVYREEWTNSLADQVVDLIAAFNEKNPEGQIQMELIRGKNPEMSEGHS